MPTPVTLRIQQQGYVRANGYAAVQWAVTEPIVDPPGDTPRATDPSSYAALFVVDRAGPREILARVATLRDYAEVPVAELEWFDVRTPGTPGRQWFQYLRVGDTLRVEGAPHWVQNQTPYTTLDFEVDAISFRTSGTAPATIVGSQLTLPGYVFTPEDVGRWVELTGFTTSAYNGMTQIVSYLGNVATVDKSFGTNETGSTWRFPWAHVRSNFTGLEKRYFPTREVNLGWQLMRDGSTIVTGTSGGASCRLGGAPRVRSVRFTTLAPSLDAGTDVFAATRAELARLHAEATRSAESFGPLVTVTEGP